jgi:hypothetical protein
MKTMPDRIQAASTMSDLIKRNPVARKRVAHLFGGHAPLHQSARA